MINMAQALGRTVSTQATQLERSRIYQIAALGALLLFAALLRFYKLGAWGFWIDEVYEIGYAQEFLQQPYFPVRLSIPLVGLALTWLGTSEFTARLVPALIGILSLFILYFPIKKLFGTYTALLSVLFLSLSTWHVYWSQNVRFYTTLLLFYALGQFFFFFWLESDRIFYLIVSALFLFLAFLERSVALYLAPVVVVYLGALWILKLGRPPALRWRNFLILAVIALFGALYLVFKSNAIAGFSEFIIGHRQNPVRVFLSVIFDLGLPMFIMALFGGVLLILQKNRAGLYFLVGALVPYIILVLISPFSQAFSRYVFLTLPNWVILGAFAVKELLEQKTTLVKLAGLAVLLLLCADAFSQNILYYGYQNGNREDFRAAYRFIEQRREPGDLVIAGWPELGEYYLGEKVIENHALTGEEIANSGKTAWIVVDNRSGFSPELQAWVEANGELMSVADVYLSGKLLMVRVYRYNPSKAAEIYPKDIRSALQPPPGGDHRRLASYLQ